MSVLRLCARRLLGTAGHSSYAAGQIRAFSSQDTAPGARVPKCRPGCHSTAVGERIQLLGGLPQVWLEVYAIFGATGGIGSELARRLAKQPGARVVAAADTKESLGELSSEVKDLHAVACNVLKRDSVAKALGEAMEKYGRLDGVVNCTGNMTMKPAHLTGEDEFMEGLRINALSSFNILSSAVQPMMRSGGGSIVLVSSSVAYHGYAAHEATAAAKGAVNGLALSAANTYAPHNIRVNVCSPGLIRTPMTERMTESKEAEDLSERMHALGRLGEASDVAAALEYLLHPSNSFVTGATLHVDGGLANVAPTNAAA